MIWIKRIAVLLVGTLLCLSAFLVGVVVFFDNATYSRAAVWVADTFFDSDLRIDGELTLHLGETLELTVGDVRLDARDDSYHFSSNSLKTAIQLRPLLSGTLWLNELQVNQLFLKVNESTTQSSGSFDPRLLPVVIAMTLTASTFGIFLMSWARTERQAGLMIGGFVTIMGMLGMLPIFVLSMPDPPQIVFTLSHLVPQGWAVEGLQIAMEGGAPADVIINSLVLLAWAALFFVIGVLRFRKRFA